MKKIRENTLNNRKETIMEHVKDVLKTSLEELERVLDTKTVVGEPIVIEGNTLIPRTVSDLVLVPVVVLERVKKVMMRELEPVPVAAVVSGQLPL